MPKEVRVQAKNYCFTSFKVNDDGTLILPVLLKEMAYICFQQEICPATQKRHVQGFVQFSDKKRISAIKKLGGIWNEAHLEIARGQVQECINYCKKPDSAIQNTFQEFGIATQKGKCSELQTAIRELEGGKSLEDIRKQFPATYIRHVRALEKYIVARDRVTTAELQILREEQLKDWQKDLINIIEIPQPLRTPHDRQVNWIFDPVGNAGKSTFIKYIVAKYTPERAYMISTTALERVVATLRAYPRPRVIMIDLPRSYPIDKFNYVALETIKDGLGYNTMYSPEMTMWTNPHVIVFSNSLPDRAKLTQDRWNIVQISEHNYDLFA